MIRGNTYIDEMEKTTLCQEKSASRSPFTVNDFGLEK